MRLFPFVVPLVIGAIFSSFAQKPKPIYKNETMPIEVRIQDLLSRMTLEEKVAQTLCIWNQKKKMLDEDKKFSPEKAASTGILKHGIGQVARPNEVKNKDSRSAKATAEYANALQKWVLENTRLAIPVMFHEESLHGNQAFQSTHFPSPLGMSSSWNEQLYGEVYSKIAEEVRLRGGHHVLAPVLDVARDPRWGRTEETMGEDPYLISRLGLVQIRAYQGEGPVFGPTKVAATLKHFGVHGQPEGGINVGPVSMDERTMREYFLPGFEACIKEGKAWGVMPCYNELNGLPVHASTRLLRDILRKEWGFKGLIVSDYEGIQQIQTLHQVSGDSSLTALKAFQAGIDIETPDPWAYPKLAGLVKTGKIPMADLDSTVARILRLKFSMGLFEKPFVDPELADKRVGNKEMRQLALKAARQSIVLLKNDQNLLPLNLSKYKKIALIGPNAARCVLGGYADRPRQCISPLEGLKEKLAGKVELLFAEGVRINDSGDWFDDEVKLSSPAENRKRIKEAVEVARQADLVILCLGGNEATSREAWAPGHAGDLTDLDLLSNQNELVDSIMNTGKPIVAGVFSGPPLSIRSLSNKVSTLMQCWYLGQEGGTAFAETILGENNPSGKLTISIPRSVGHIPCFYNYKPSSRRNYHFDSTSALFPFGFGLSYTQFSYGKPLLSKSQIGKEESTVLAIEVANKGQVEGDEIVQLYIRDLVSGLTRPVKELKDFARVTLKPGETKTVEFKITSEKLSYYGPDNRKVLEPGNFSVQVGKSSIDLQSVELRVQ
jgi:beta-glucosidase